MLACFQNVFALAECLRLRRCRQNGTMVLFTTCDAKYQRKNDVAIPLAHCERGITVWLKDTQSYPVLTTHLTGIEERGRYLMTAGSAPPPAPAAFCCCEPTLAPLGDPPPVELSSTPPSTSDAGFMRPLDTAKRGWNSKAGNSKPVWQECWVSVNC